MTLFIKKALIATSVAALCATSASAGWVTLDGTPYTADCCKVKKIKKVRKVKKACTTCDYSKFPMAQVMPLEPGERLAPARLGNCGMKR